MPKSLRQYLFADYQAMSLSAKQPSWGRVLKLYLQRMAYRVVVNYRLGQWSRRRGWRWLGAWFDRRSFRRGTDICSAAQIGEGIRIAHPHGIVIGGAVETGSYCHILQGVTLGGNSDKVREGDPTWTMPRLGRRVRIGPGAKVLGPVWIGDDAVVGANAVVTKDVQSGCIVGGIPAKPIGTTARADEKPQDGTRRRIFMIRRGKPARRTKPKAKRARRTREVGEKCGLGRSRWPGADGQ